MLAGLENISVARAFLQAQTDAAPDSAGRDFYSGVFFGWIGEDVKADMDLCFPADAELTSALEDMFNAQIDEDWDTYGDAMNRANDAFETDIQSCKDNYRVWTVAQDLASVVMSFEKLDDWETILRTNIDDNIQAIKGYGVQSLLAWNSGVQFFEAGSLAGTVDAIMFKFPEN